MSAAVSIALNSTWVPPTSNSKTQPLRISRSEQQLIIQDVAKRCLIELAVSLIIATASCFFTATLLHGTLLFAAIAVQTVCNAALRYAGAIAARAPDCPESQWILKGSSYFCTTAFAYLTAVNAQTLIHEGGHALTANLLFQNANPRNILTPCMGGMTRFNTTHLTSLGEKIGRNGALFITTIVGPAATLLVSGIAMVVGFVVQAKFPELAYYLIGVGRGDFYAHSFYALTALSSSPPTTSHDFVRLRTYGIHPLASAIAILAAPFLITWAFERAAQSNSTP